MGIPENFTCLLRNLYAGQEATVRTGHGTMDWFKIGKGIRQGCILSPCLFNLYAEYIMRNAGLEEAQAGISGSRPFSWASPAILLPSCLSLPCLLRWEHPSTVCGKLPGIATARKKPANLILVCSSSNLEFLMMYSACKLNKQGDNIQP